MQTDFKKVQKDLYQPCVAPSVVDVPDMVFLAADGKGEPNTNKEYASTAELLYEYINLAVAEGAADAISVTPEDIVFDGRTLIKCMYGCSDWSKGCTCPSRAGSLKPWEWEPLLRKYTTVLIIHSHDKRIAQKASYAVEREAFLNGDVLAFSMSDCALCAECAGRTGLECCNPKMARPAFHSVGIDVFATVRKLRLPLKPLYGRDEEQNWYAAVWLNL